MRWELHPVRRGRAANQPELDIVEELAQVAQWAGVTLFELAIAFVINHRGVTSAVVGPRTMEQLESGFPPNANAA
ncbi:aryl-alcohol dehydrogenase-like predicted oxidoreductase [Pseudarthrobacter sp. W1I19]|nr:aldo/keto reductase [Pseudarthrobacter sp. W1I19]MDQ0923770.1 aryl-alcohol dehydrogenase-like predicted oxidoreductase [Pseudarthrobacter sp. W1I19]